MKTLLIAAATTAVMAASPAMAQGDAEAGKKIVEGQCVTCHGMDGLSQNPGWPILGGQYYDYLVHSLQAYKSGTRKNAIMAGFATGLSEEDMQNVAAWYANQKPGVHVSPNP